MRKRPCLVITAVSPMSSQCPAQNRYLTKHELIYRKVVDWKGEAGLSAVKEFGFYSVGDRACGGFLSRRVT